MAFVPRFRFPYPSQATPSWFVGHMSKGLRLIEDKLHAIDLIVEARDARLPLTSINPLFEGFATGSRKRISQKQRFVVYCKRDLGDQRLEKPLIDAFKRHAGHPVAFVDTSNDIDVRSLLKQAVAHVRKGQGHEEDEAKQKAQLSEHGSVHQRPVRMLVVGLPNVGKSSLLNAFRRVGVRKGKVATVGPEAGVTKNLGGVVRILDSPPTYIYDTPGIFVPYLGKGPTAIERGLKIALTAGIKENVFDPEVVADYLLFRLNWRYFLPWLDTSEADLPRSLQGLKLPTNDVYTLFERMAHRVNAVVKGSEVDHERAALGLMRLFRDGKLGQWQLDDLGVASDLHGLPPPAAENAQGPRKPAALPIDDDVAKAVDRAVYTWFASEVSAYERPSEETMSGHQLRKARSEIAANATRARQGLAPRSGSPRISKSLAERRLQRRQVKWDLSVGPSRHTEERVRTGLRRGKYSKRDADDPMRIRPRRFRRAAQELKRRQAEREGRNLPRSGINVPAKALYARPKRARELIARAGERRL